MNFTNVSRRRDYNFTTGTSTCISSVCKCLWLSFQIFLKLGIQVSGRTANRLLRSVDNWQVRSEWGSLQRDWCPVCHCPAKVSHVPSCLHITLHHLLPSYTVCMTDHQKRLTLLSTLLCLSDKTAWLNSFKGIYKKKLNSYRRLKRSKKFSCFIKTKLISFNPKDLADQKLKQYRAWIYIFLPICLMHKLNTSIREPPASKIHNCLE